MFKLSVLAIVVAAANCQAPVVDHHHTLPDPHWLDHRQRDGRYYRPPITRDETPKPYSFNYDALDEDGIGSSSRREMADATGRVEGSYSLTNDEGHTRFVQYVADEGGFRAHIRTNEPGTDNQNPADVVIESQAPSVGGHIHYRPHHHYRGERPVEVVNPIVTDEPQQPPVRPTPLPWHQSVPSYADRPYHRYGRPYPRYD